ncbi:hypothetical protein AVJ23_04915 [Pseudoponticoccus marisrubri]|uniref:Uncharacterized protein n=2 Tax=Pseudoponticoccus marisrubri TaxID=1685382 RepID=A0A0W7WMV0_9RHOB|nr:hypothetical protein AVJ23_04915 [Pseudoponticoccus marisrubri]
MLAVVLLYAAVPMASAQNWCRPPAELLGLAATLSALPPGSDRLSDGRRARIGEILDGLNERRMLAALDAGGLQALTPSVLSLLAEARHLADSGTRRNPGYLDEVLAEFDAALMRACAESRSTIYQRLQQDRVGGLFDDGVDLQELARRANGSGVVGLGVILSGVLGFTAALILFDAGFRWIMALVYNRKACRIPAVLLVADARIEGLVITLGRGGCRFYPTDFEAFESALPGLAAGEQAVDLEGTVLPARISAIHGPVADFRFVRALSLKAQRALLTQSTISPYYIKKGFGADPGLADELV